MIVRVTHEAAHLGVLELADLRLKCALGPAGIQTEKREGDGATPKGRFPLRGVRYRADRMARPATGLPVSVIGKTDGWCDDPSDAGYNTLVKLPYPASAEQLWRTDGVYDLIVVVGHNDDPVVPGAGSAIFMHIANQAFGPTEGCVALEREALLAVISRITEGAVLETRAA